MKTKILIVISNPWTYRNIFCTTLAGSLYEKYEIIFCCSTSEKMTDDIKAKFPLVKTIYVPFLKLTPTNSEILHKQYICEAGYYPGNSKYLFLKYLRSRDTSRRYKIGRFLGMKLYRPTASKFDLTSAMNAFYNGLLMEPLSKEIQIMIKENSPDYIWLGTTFLDFDLLVLANSYKMGQRIISTVLGWDNLSSKVLPPVPSDAYLIWGDSMEKDIKPYLIILQRSIPLYKVGSPQFDIHASFIQSNDKYKNQTLIKYGLDPDKPVIFYGGTNEFTMANEHELVLDLVKTSRSEISPELQWFIRLHPKDDGGRWNKIKQLENVSVYQSRSETDFNNWLPNNNQLIQLVEQVSFSKIVLNNASTVTLDACLMDKPVITIRYEPNGKKVRRSDFLFEYDHFRNAVNSNAFPVCNSVSEVINEIKLALKNPDERSKNRKDFTGNVLVAPNGSMSEKILEAIYNITA